MASIVNRVVLDLFPIALLANLGNDSPQTSFVQLWGQLRALANNRFLEDNRYRTLPNRDERRSLKPMEIPDNVHSEIKELCAEGDVFLEMREFADAYNNYSSALKLVPEPKEHYQATTWIMAALGDMYFQAKDFSQAEAVLSDAMHCVGAIGNPFLHLRLGQSQLELGNDQRAADELCRAYMGAGKEIFEKEDRKYFDFLKTKILPPANGEW
jgi:tetratricopeptide (TPR) repeat protein